MESKEEKKFRDRNICFYLGWDDYLCYLNKEVHRVCNSILDNPKCINFKNTMDSDS